MEKQILNLSHVERAFIINEVAYGKARPEIALMQWIEAKMMVEKAIQDRLKGEKE